MPTSTGPREAGLLAPVGRRGKGPPDYGKAMLKPTGSYLSRDMLRYADKYPYL